MMPATRAATAMILMVSLLAGCGPEGSPGQPSGGGTSAPAPTPSPGATALAFPPAPFGLQATTPFVLVGWQEISSTPAAYARADDVAQLAWSTDLKTYAIALRDSATGKLAYTFPGNNPAAFSIIQADGSTARVYVTVVTRGPSVGWLHWQSADGVSPFMRGEASFGIAPRPGGLPVTGRRMFPTDASDASRGITFDFAARTVSGTFTTRYDNGWDPPGAPARGTLETAELHADGTFLAKVSVPGAPSQGELHGRLVGPDGDQMIVYWNGQVPGPYAMEPWVLWRATGNYAACTGCSS